MTPKERDLVVLPDAVVKTFIVLGHGFQAHTHTGETAVVKNILHGDLFGQIREKRDTEISTILRIGISKRRHPVGKIEQAFNAFYTTSGCC